MNTRQAFSEQHVRTPRGQAILVSHYVGPHPLIHFFLQRINLSGIISGCLGTGSREGIDGYLTQAEALEVLIHNILVAPSPLYRLSNWVASIDASALGLNDDQKKAVNDDRLGRALDALASQRGRNLFFHLALRILKEFRIDTHRIHFDTTTVTFSGDYRGSVSEPAIRRGMNKDHRPDLKQLLFGLNVSSDGAVPVSHQLFSGNRTDDSVHQGNLQALRRILGKEDFIYVADCKLCTSKNLAYVTQAGGKFVTILPRSRKEDKDFRRHLRASKVRWSFLLKIPSHRRFSDPPDRLYTCKGLYDTSHEGYRLIWIRSSSKAKLDSSKRDAIIQAAVCDLNELSSKLNRGQYKSRPRIKKASASILAQHGVKDLLHVKISSRTVLQTHFTRRGRPKPSDPVATVRSQSFSLDISLDKDQIEAEARTDGVFPMITNLPSSFGKRDIVRIYKYQAYVEKRFSSLKSELCVAPVYLKKPIRVAGLVHAYFIALCVASLIERTLRTNMMAKNIPHLPLFPEHRPSESPTAPRILEAFSSLTWFEFSHPDSSVTFPIQLSDLQKQLLSLLEVPIYTYL